MSKIWRIDPIDCGCSDCGIGESKPIDCCTQKELKKAHKGKIVNASCMYIKKKKQQGNKIYLYY